ncbi:hypothetical protein JOM56_014017 [Amanita muscaria]
MRQRNNSRICGTKRPLRLLSFFVVLVTILWTPAAASRFFDSAKAELPRLRVSLRHLQFPNSPHAKYIFIDNHKQWKHTSCKNFS